MKNKSKKNKTPVFKSLPKTDNEESQIKEYQIKKKILEEKYSNFFLRFFSFYQDKCRYSTKRNDGGKIKAIRH